MIKIIKKMKKYFITFSLKRFLSIISIFVIASFLIILGIIFSLLYSTNLKSNDLKKVSLGKNRYTLIDNFYNPDDFYQFRQNAENINILAKFYNELVSSDEFEMLSIFNQSLQVENFQGDKSFYYNTETFLERNQKSDLMIRSLQLNDIAFNYYNLELKEGAPFIWSEISYDKDTIPILVGNDYIGTYKVGDTINGNYYTKEKRFKIVGILEENSFIYYQNDPEFYLDKYIIIPYPQKLWSVDEKDYLFESILYFALINCDIITSVNESLFIEEIKTVANKTEFLNFSVVGIDDFKIKYLQLISVIKENEKILITMLAFIFFLVIFILYSFSRIIIDKQFLVYQTHWIIGDKFYKKIFIVDIGLSYIVAYITAIIIQMVFLEKVFIPIILIQFMILLSVFIFVYYSGNKLITRKLED